MTERKARTTAEAKTKLRSRFPAQMTERKAMAKTALRSRFPLGVTETKARAEARTKKALR
jgi:hypothetical protein